MAFSSSSSDFAAPFCALSMCALARVSSPAAFCIACEAAGEDVSVFADIGPIPHEENVDHQPEYRAIVDRFLTLGAENFLFETFSSDEELRGKRNAARVTGQYTMGASEFVAGFGWAGKWDNMSNSGARQLILGYNYNLSKRSKLFAGYTKVDNKANASYATGIAGADFSTFALGMRHNF